MSSSKVLVLISTVLLLLSPSLDLQAQVPLPPLIHSCTLQGNNVTLTFSSAPEHEVILQSTTDLTAPVTWTSTPGVTSPYTAPASSPARYFRLKAMLPDGSAYYSLNAVGYLRRTMLTGTNLVANPFNTPDNTLDSLLPNCPEGCLLYKNFGRSSAFMFGSWQPGDLTLYPGEGAVLVNPSAPFVVTFAGEVPEGALNNGISAGVSLLSSIAPVTGLLAFPAQEGDIIQTWNSTSQAPILHEYFGGTWFEAEPSVPPGGAFWVTRSQAAMWVQNFTVQRPVEVEPPCIYRQPVSRTNDLGTTAAFTVAATGTPPLAYQWLFNGLSLQDGGRIAGASTATLTVQGVQRQDGGEYSVVVSNPHGSVTSSTAKLTVPTDEPWASLLAEFLFEGTLEDSSGYNNLMDAKNLVLTDGALYLNGIYEHAGQGETNGFRAIARVPQLDYASFTVSVDVRPVQTSWGQPILVGGSLYRWLELAYRADHLLVLGLNNGVSATSFSSAPIAPDTWQRISVAVDLSAQSIRVYRNGARVGSVNLPDNFTFNVVGTGAEELDKALTFSDYGSGTAYHGLADNLVVLDRPISDEEAASLPWDLPAPPEITTQPTGSTNDVGTTATFAVVATGASPLAYQWRFNGVNLQDGGRISGATAATLTITDVQVSDAGEYSVRVSNTYGGVTSSVAILTVPGSCAPVFFDGFESYTVGTPVSAPWSGDGAGARVSASVSFSGEKSLELPGAVGGCLEAICDRELPTARELLIECTIRSSSNHRLGCHPYDAFIGIRNTRSWTTADKGRAFVTFNHGTQNILVDGDRYVAGAWQYDQWYQIAMRYQKAATNILLTIWVDGVQSGPYSEPIDPEEDTMRYLEFSSGDGTTWVDDVRVSACTPAPQAPSILLQPTNTVATLGGSTTLTVAAAGAAPLAYLWRKDGVPLEDGPRISGSTTAKLTLTDIQYSDAGSYSVMVSNSYGSAWSDMAVLELSCPPFTLSPATLPEGSLGIGYSATLSCTGQGGWRPTASMQVSRAWHTITLLPDGKALVAGGGTNAISEIYDPVTGTWEPTGSLRTPRWVHRATSLADGRVLVVGGLSGNDYLSSAEVYDPAAGTWTETGAMSTPRSLHTATLLPDGKVLVAGGDSGTVQWTASAELYDPATGKWTATGNMTSAHDWHTATLLPNGQVLVAGGTPGGFWTSRAELYDPAMGIWAVTGSMRAGRGMHMAALLLDGKVLVLNGVGSGNMNLTSAELYDPSSGTWEATGGLSTTRYNGGEAVLLADGRVLVEGGYDGVSYLSTTELYDPDSELWTTITPMNTAHDGGAAILLRDGRVLVTGGGNTSGSLSIAELYAPEAGRTFAVTSGSLPSGLSLSTNGLLSGIPTEAGTFNFTVAATDAYGCQGTRAYALKVGGVSVWARRVARTSSTDDELALGLATDAAGNLFVSGWFDGVNDFGGTTLTSYGGQDAYVAKYSSAGVLQWVRQAGGTSAEWECARAVGVDAAGNAYVTGGFLGVAKFDGTTLTSFAHQDCFLARYNASGELQWVRQGSDAWHSTYGTGIAVDGAGNSVVVGYFEGQTVTFGSVSAANPGYSDDNYAIFLVKYNNSGVPLWARGLGGGDCYSTTVGMDVAGNCYVAGSFKETLQVGGTTLVSSGDKDGFIAKYDSLGALQWVRQAKGPSKDGARLGVDSDGNSYLVGAFSGSITLGTTQLVSASSNAFYVARFNPAGDLLWARMAEGGAYNEGGCAVDAAGDCYIPGISFGPMDFNGTTTMSHGGWDIFAAKYDRLGNFQWVQTGGGTGDDGAFRMAIDSAGNCFVAGWFQGAATIGTNVLSAQGYRDSFVARLSQPEKQSLQFAPANLTVSGGQLQMRLDGPVGMRVVVETSVDLQTWTPWQTSELPTGGLQLSAPLSAEQRYFRGRVVP